MDALDLIRAFRRHVKEPSDDARRRAAARLADAIGDTPTGKPTLPVPSTTLRRVAAVLAVVAATAAALFMSTPWEHSPGFLARAEAALTPPASTVLHVTTEITQSTKEFGCTVTRGPTEYWLDERPPRQYRAKNEFLPGNPWNPLAVSPRRFHCTRGIQAEMGGDAHRLFVFVPPDTLRWSGINLHVVSSLDIVANLRQALATGHAHHDGQTQLAGRTVERIRSTPPTCPPRGCEDIFAYVDPQTLYPIRIDGYVLTAGEPGQPTPIRSRVVIRYLMYEYLPRTAANLALTDIQAQHPNATKRYY